MPHFYSRITLAAALALSTSLASAQTTPQICQLEPQIIDLAEAIIEMRPSIPRNRVGYNAAYLLMRYKDMPAAEGLALVERLRQDGGKQSSTLDQLEIAFAISTLGVQAGLSLHEQDPLEVFASARYPILRAIILSDGGQRFFDMLAELENAPDLLTRFQQTYVSGAGLPIVIRDQSDAFKQRFAEIAEANGAPIPAGLVLANLADLTAYSAFLARYADDTRTTNFAGEEIANSSGLVHISQTTPTEIRRSFTETERAQNQLEFDIYKAAMLNRELDALQLVFYLSGEKDISPVARRYIAALQAGTITPLDDPEAAWLFIHKALIEEIGMQTTFDALEKFDQPPTLRHFADTALQTMDWVVAKAALKPYMRGETNTLPARPNMLSPNIKWEKWTSLALMIRPLQALPDETLYSRDTKIAVELLYIQGEIDRALALAARELPPKELVYIYRDFMQRLDLRCEAYSDYPAKAILLGGRTLFRFLPNAP